MRKRYQTVLRLNRLSVLEKVNKARAIVASMTGNAYFNNPNPPLATITADADDLEKASAAAENGGKTLTADMHVKEEVLVHDLHLLAAYVEAIANEPPNLLNAAAVITSAGMDVKTVHAHGPSEFQANPTGIAGEFKLRTAFVLSCIYHWQSSTDGVNWKECGVSRKASFVCSGLTAGTKYYFRVCIEGSEGMSPWSDPISAVAA